MTIPTRSPDFPNRSVFAETGGFYGVFIVNIMLCHIGGKCMFYVYNCHFTVGVIFKLLFIRLLCFRVVR